MLVCRKTPTYKTPKGEEHWLKESASGQLITTGDSDHDSGYTFERKANRTLVDPVSLFKREQFRFSEDQTALAKFYLYLNANSLTYFCNVKPVTHCHISKFCCLDTSNILLFFFNALFIQCIFALYQQESASQLHRNINIPGSYPVWPIMCVSHWAARVLLLIYFPAQIHSVSVKI